MLVRGSPTSRLTRVGSSYVEVVVASVVFSMSIAFVATNHVTQEKVMRALEQRVYVLKPTNASVTDINLDLSSGESRCSATLNLYLPPEESEVFTDPYFRQVYLWGLRLGATEMTTVDGRPGGSDGQAQMLLRWEINQAGFDGPPPEAAPGPFKPTEILVHPADSPGTLDVPPHEQSTSVTVRVTG